MIIKNADKNSTELPALVRAKYSFKHIARQVRRTDNAEPIVGQTEIEKAGLLCKPFWDTPGDHEGECYSSYIKFHPDFSLSIRSSVLDRLIKAQHMLPSNWRIVLKAGYRPLSVQQDLLKSLLDETYERFPDWDYNQRLTHARTYVSDPSILCPPHVTGGAVDIDIFDTSLDTYVDMGCPPNTDNEIAYIFNASITKRQQMNRMTLLRSMISAEFAPLVNEWWHFQYGETYWAAFYGYEQTKYDLITV